MKTSIAWIALLSLLTGCSNLSDKEQHYLDAQTDDVQARFTKNMHVDIVIDRKTGCKYFYSTHTDTVMTPLYKNSKEVDCDRDDTP